MARGKAHRVKRLIFLDNMNIGMLRRPPFVPVDGGNRCVIPSEPRPTAVSPPRTPGICPKPGATHPARRTAMPAAHPLAPAGPPPRQPLHGRIKPIKP
jgi:hypothetical protein